MHKRIFLVGVVVDDTDRKRIHWRLIGAYSKPEVAEAHCTTPDHFVRPVYLDEAVPENGNKPAVAYFPLDED